MAGLGSVERVQVATDLLLLRSLPAPLRVALVAAVSAASTALGAWSLNVQHHFAAAAGTGRVAVLLAHGSSAVTAWEGWAAAAFFAAALLRLRWGVPEPPAGRTPIEELTAGQLRSGLVREYTMVRSALVILCVVSLTDAARAARYVAAALAGDRLARGSLAATVVEACGLVAATVILAMWGAAFRDQLLRMGALNAQEPGQVRRSTT